MKTMKIVTIHLISLLLSSSLFAIPGLEIKLNNNIFDKKENITTKTITLINNSNTTLDIIIKCLDWNRKDYRKSKLSQTLTVDTKFLRLKKHQRKDILATAKNTLMDGEKYHIIKIGKSTLTHKHYKNIPNIAVPLIIKNSALDNLYIIKFLNKDNKNYVKIKNIGNSINFSNFETIVYNKNKPIETIEISTNLNHNESIEIPLKLKEINSNLNVVLTRKTDVI